MIEYKIEYNVPCPQKAGNAARTLFKKQYDQIFYFVHSNKKKLILDLGDKSYKQFYSVINTGNKKNAVSRYDDVLYYTPIGDNKYMVVKNEVY